MARAAEDDGSRLNKFACHSAHTFDTILADPNDGQPSMQCGRLKIGKVSGRHEKTYPDSWRYNGGATARGTPRGPDRSRGDHVARWSYRIAFGTAGTRKERRLRRGCRAFPVSARP